MKTNYIKKGISGLRNAKHQNSTESFWITSIRSKSLKAFVGNKPKWRVNSTKVRKSVRKKSNDRSYRRKSEPSFRWLFIKPASSNATFFLRPTNDAIYCFAIAAGWIPLVGLAGLPHDDVEVARTELRCSSASWWLVMRTGGTPNDFFDTNMSKCCCLSWTSRRFFWCDERPPGFQGRTNCSASGTELMQRLLFHWRLELHSQFAWGFSTFEL
jgi:hypothetical protein